MHPIAPPPPRPAALLLLAGKCPLRRRALLDTPGAAHSGASNCFSRLNQPERFIVHKVQINRDAEHSYTSPLDAPAWLSKCGKCQTPRRFLPSQHLLAQQVDGLRIGISPALPVMQCKIFGIAAD